MTGTAYTRVGFRPDIEGLRALAVGLVVLYHAGLPWLPGGYVGVDVFFVISGYLMTALVLRELDATGTVRLRAFYARRIRRLLPAAVLVLVSTLALAKLLLPPLALPTIAKAGAATALYVSNVWFAYTGTDYLASEAPSPLQHYWSLAVEEQFYLVWPVLLVLAFRLFRGSRARIGVGLVLLVVASFLLCLVTTSVSQPWAFFSLPTRAWELGVGGLVALAAGRLALLPVALARALTWAGLLVAAASALLYTDATTFPGWAATVPVMATAALLAGGLRQAPGSADVVLARRPMQVVGRLSYSLYLWHWPVLVLPAARYGELSPATRAALVLLAVALAWLMYRFVEDPVRRSGRLAGRPGRSYALSVAVTAVALAAALGAGVLPKLATDQRVPELTTAAVARAVASPAVVPANVSPALASVSDDLPPTYRDGCHADFEVVTPGPCQFGDGSASRTVMLLGDSHAAQWFPALDRLAADDGWRFISLTKSACPSIDVLVPNDSLGRPYTECQAWNDAVVSRVHAEQPDVVVLSNFAAKYIELQAQASPAPWTQALQGFIERLPERTQVVILGDTPAWEQSPVDCLSAHITGPGACSRAVGELIDEEIQAGEAALAGGRVTFAPTFEWVCDGTCPALGGNVVVYRDQHHLTATMAALLVDRIRSVVPGADGSDRGAAESGPRPSTRASGEVGAS
ncbi:acyltransferase family protein [Blastococcus sp. SYSU DS0552]